MLSLTDLSGLAGISFAVSLMLVRLPGLREAPACWRMGMVVCAFAVCWLPFGALSAAEFVRGITGDLSVSSLALLLAGSGLVKGWQLAERARSEVLLAIALAALSLYPFALGIGGSDPYRWGYGNGWFLGGLALAALGAWRFHRTLLAGGISLAALAWSVGWYESGNLWDYLIDPWGALYALGALSGQGWRRLRRQA